MNAPRLTVHLGAADLADALRRDVRAGFAARPRQLPPTWFYDARGSALFDRITLLPEYYPTRAERSVLIERSAAIAQVTGAKTLVELGSGSSEKTRWLLDALQAYGSLGGFVPFDVSEAALRDATAALAAAYPQLDVHAVAGDFTRHLVHLPTGAGRLVAFLGSTIGNLRPEQRARFLAELRAVLEPGEWFLLGADLIKDPDVLVRAYDDAAGVTAEFNRNVLHVLNRELGADFVPDAFDHVARWNRQHEWIEMRLRSRAATRVRVPALDLTVDFEAGEDLLTEVSAKFRRGRLERELGRAGFVMHRWWTDRDRLFSVSLWQASAR